MSLTQELAPPYSFLHSGDGDDKLARTWVYEKPGQGSAFGAMFNVANAALGAGVLAFPFAFRHTGIIGGFIMTAFVCFISFLSVMIIINNADQHAATSYQQLVRRVFGRKMELILEVFIFLYVFGACTAYLIVIGDQATPVFAHWTDDSDSVFVSRRFLIAALGIVLVFPLCLIKRISALSFTSTIATASVLFLAFSVIFLGITGDGGAKGIQDNDGLPDGTKMFVIDFKSFLAFPIVCFAFQCHVSATPIYADMKNRTPSEFRKVAIGAFMTCFTLYTLTGAAGYWSFGNDTKSDVLERYQSSNVMVMISRLGITLVASFSFPLLHYLGRSAIMDLTAYRIESQGGDPQDSERKRFYLSTTLFFLASLGIAMAVTNIGAVIGLIGATAVVMFIFIVPGMMLLRQNNRRGGQAFIVIGIILGLLSTVISVYSDIDGE